jgi:hypothetical protein
MRDLTWGEVNKELFLKGWAELGNVGMDRSCGWERTITASCHQATKLKTVIYPERASHGGPQPLLPVSTEDICLPAPPTSESPHLLVPLLVRPSWKPVKIHSTKGHGTWVEKGRK